MAEVTYYFNAYTAAVWTNPNKMVDGDLATFGQTATKNATQVLTANDCPGTDLGTITKTEIRCYGYGDGDDKITLNGTALVMPSSAGWSGYVDVGITTWAGIVALDATVQYTVVGKSNTMYCAKVEIRVTYIEYWIPPESDIDIGADVLDRAFNALSGYTRIAKDNPANADGILHTVDVWAVATITGFRVGTFYLTGSNKLKCRDSVLIGDVGVPGWQRFSGLSIEVVAGDYIGCYFTGGELEIDTAGYGGRWHIAGEYIDPNDEATYTFYPNEAISLYGFGDIEVGAEWKKLAFASEPPTPNAWNQLKLEAGTGWRKLLLEGD